MSSKRAARAVLARVGALEARLHPFTAPRHPPLFVVGPPRSGTTLAYQAICAGLRVAFPTNLMLAAGFERAPHLYRLVARALGSRLQVADFTSEHGRTAGPGSPHEAGVLWNRWFDGPTLVPGADGPLRATVAAIEAAFGAPFVNKNVMHTPRLVALAEVLPQARFLEIRRDLEANARSIVRARERAGATTAWWSVAPSNVEALRGRPLIEQARGQVLGLQADLVRARQVVGEHRFFTWNYEDFCADPRGALAALASAWGVETRLERVPHRFQARG